MIDTTRTNGILALICGLPRPASLGLAAQLLDGAS